MKACVDIGGTKVAVSLADIGTAPVGAGPLGRLAARRSEPTVKQGARDALAQQVLRMIRDACVEVDADETRIEAVGISSCGPFVLQDGLVELAAPNLCGGLAGVAQMLPNNWRTAILEAPLRERFGNVRVENDGIGALEAERRWGALQNVDNCAYITWSTGIGAALCVDGKILRGKNGNAGHAGHMYVSDGVGQARCGCGNVNDVESLVSGIAIARRFGRDPSALLTAAAVGERGAVAIVDELCRVMGRMLYDLIVTLDLSRISLGGSVFWHHRELLLPRLSHQVMCKFPALTDGIELVGAGLGDKVGDLAALALVG